MEISGQYLASNRPGAVRRQARSGFRLSHR
jgi:hypothetical protein